MSETAVAPQTEAKGEVTPGEAAAPEANDGGKPDNQATLQTVNNEEAPSTPTEQAPVKPAEEQKPADTKPQRTEAEIERDLEARKAAEAKEQERQRNIKATQDDLRKYRREAPIQARDYFAALRDEGYDVPLELQKPLLDLVNDGLVKGEAAARLDFEDQLSNGETQGLRDLSALVTDGYYSAVPANLHEEYTALVNNKPPSEWAKGLLALATKVPSVQAAILADLQTALTGAAPEGAEREGLTEALKGAKDVSGAVKAALDNARNAGAKWPSGEPRGAKEMAPGHQYTYAEVSKMNKAQLDALPEGVFERVMGMTRS